MMVKFIFKLLLLICIVATLNYIVVCYTVKYDIDEFYAKIASPKSVFMITGSSRASQGIRPDIAFNDMKAQQPMNFAFTMANSPYGKTYFNAIQQKLDESKHKGCFILEVSPQALSIDTTKTDSIYAEDYYFLNTIWSMSRNPNLSYLYAKYPKPLYKLLLSKNSSTLNLHSNGWLEVKVQPDILINSPTTRKKINDYNRVLATRKLDETRIEYLRAIIKLCKLHGDVILVRLPASKPMMEIEDKYYPMFNDTMLSIATQLKTPYLNLDSLAGKINTTDGSHIWRDDAKRVSQIINHFIKQQKHE